MVSRQEVEEANGQAVSKMVESEPYLIDILVAGKELGIRGKKLLHAGPPISWEHASGPLRGALIGACIYEGWAENEKEAEKLLSRNEVLFEPTHHYNCVGPMAGVISPSMPIYVVADAKSKTRAYSNMNEGIGKVLRYGAYDHEVIKRLRWLETFASVLKDSLRIARKETGGIALKPLISQALTMGDDCHNRYVATTSLFSRIISPYIIKSLKSKKESIEVMKFIESNNFTTLNVGMAAAKCMTLCAHNVEKSTIVTVMSRNGTEVGIWVSSLGNKWFTSKAPVPKGVFFPGYSQEDANPDIGDSAITETAGYGGFAMAAAPAIVSWVGGSVESAIETTRKMYEITFTEHKYFQIPYLAFRGTPTGIDIRKVLKKGITPTINTGIAHRDAGVGQIGAGVVSLPPEVFEKAFASYVEKYG